VRRVPAVGNSGAGKNAARRLAAMLDVPFLELDAIFHPAGLAAAAAGGLAAAGGPGDGERRLGVDGNSSAVRDLVWARADTVVWLDLPRRTVLRELVWRTLCRTAAGRKLWNTNREPLTSSGWVPGRTWTSYSPEVEGGRPATSNHW
jgi:adenylate kinase family enzyme